MRPADWAEIACQYPEGTSRSQIAYIASLSGEAWVASRLGQPIAAFGAHPLSGAGNVLSVWCFGTRATRRVVPAITRFIREDCVPRWIAAGVTRVEARSIDGHFAAHRWMRALGATGVLTPGWGRDGENFTLFAWTARDWNDVLLQ